MQVTLACVCSSALIGAYITIEISGNSPAVVERVDLLDLSAVWQGTQYVNNYPNFCCYYLICIVFKFSTILLLPN